MSAPRIEALVRISRISAPCLTLLGHMCPRPSVVIFEDGRFMLHHDGNGVGTQIDERTLAQLMKLRTVTRMPDADPASTSSAGRAVLRSRHAPQSRATIGAHTARILTGATLTGNACVMQSMGERVPAELMVGQGKVSNHASKGQGVCLSRTQMKYDHH